MHRQADSEAAIFARLWEFEDSSVSSEILRHILKLEFSARDKARMHELAARNQEGLLSPQEEEELDNFVRVGDLVSILQSKVRKLLPAEVGHSRDG
jgi:hypothetical protein